MVGLQDGLADPQRGAAAAAAVGGGSGPTPFERPAGVMQRALQHATVQGKRFIAGGVAVAGRGECGRAQAAAGGPATGPDQ